MDQNAMMVSDLFQDRPPRWGLRGDPMLWDDMRAVLSDRPLPADVQALQTLLARAFQALTGTALDCADAALAVEAYHRPCGGMSNGQVSPRFWRDTALPLILARFQREIDLHGPD